MHGSAYNPQQGNGDQVQHDIDERHGEIDANAELLMTGQVQQTAGGAGAHVDQLTTDERRRVDAPNYSANGAWAPELWNRRRDTQVGRNVLSI